jgi:hypothetical protein
MKLKNKICLTILAIFSILCFSIILYGSTSLKSIDVTFSGSKNEHTDKYIPGINKNEKAPDYALSVITMESTELIGIKKNKYIGSGVMTFLSLKEIPVKLIKEIKLEDDDPVKNDVLERVVFSQNTINGMNYKFFVKTKWSFNAGIVYFWATPLGNAILFGIILGVLVVVISNFDF